MALEAFISHAGHNVLYLNSFISGTMISKCFISMTIGTLSNSLLADRYFQKNSHYLILTVSIQYAHLVPEI